MKKNDPKKILDIIIPAYQAHETLPRTLSSIMIQEFLPYTKVTIVNDCGDSYTQIVKHFNKYMDITELKTPQNGGPGVARQFGIDNTCGEYIMFCDADDIIGGDFLTLNLMVDRMSNTNCDMLIGTFIDQKYDKNTDTVIHTPISNDPVWVHGKMYRRSSLVEHNIRFKNDLRSNEDSYFNYCCKSRFSKIETTDIITYTWLYNKNSITADDSYNVLGYEGWYRALEYHINECKELSKTDKYATIITPEYIEYQTAHALIVGYLEYNEFCHIYEESLVEKFLQYLDRYYKNIFREAFLSKDLSEWFNASYTISKSAIGRNYCHPPFIGLDAFIQMLEERYQKNLN